MELGFYSLDLWCDVMNLHAVFVGHHHVVCSPGVCSQDHTILTEGQEFTSHLADVSLFTSQALQQPPGLLDTHASQKAR